MSSEKKCGTLTPSGKRVDDSNGKGEGERRTVNQKSLIMLSKIRRTKLLGPKNLGGGLVLISIFLKVTRI